MANVQRGEVSVVGRDGTVYTLKLGIAAICALEQTLDRPVLQLFDELQKGTMRVTTVREFAKAATSENDEEKANVMLENVGITGMLGVISDCLLATFGVNDKVNPQTPARKKAGAGSSKQPVN